MYSCLLGKKLGNVTVIRTRRKLGKHLGSCNNQNRADIKGSSALLPKSNDVHANYHEPSLGMLKWMKWCSCYVACVSDILKCDRSEVTLLYSMLNWKFYIVAWWRKNVYTHAFLVIWISFQAIFHRILVTICGLWFSHLQVHLVLKELVRRSIAATEVAFFVLCFSFCLTVFLSFLLVDLIILDIIGIEAIPNTSIRYSCCCKW